MRPSSVGMMVASAFEPPSVGMMASSAVTVTAIIFLVLNSLLSFNLEEICFMKILHEDTLSILEFERNINRPYA